jgi:CRP-like cAMP-binding protein
MKAGHQLKAIPKSQSGNLTLRSLSQTDFGLLNSTMESVALKRGMVVGMTHEPFDYAYFPIDAVISLAGTTLDGLSVEIGMVGHEGYLGLPILFGKRIHLYQATVQHHGSALRVPGGVLEEALHASRTLYEQLLRYSTVRFVQLAQTAVCHRFHSLEQRLCRWLLSMHDRVRDHEIRLTHEGLAHLIGGRRPTINTITNELKKSGIVEYRRGSLVIRDRTGLERLTCECYRIIAQAIRGLT